MNYNEILSKRAQGIKPSGIRRFFDIVESMPDAISLGVGEPDFPTPWHIAKAGIDSIVERHTRYTANRGMGKLCEAICEYLHDRFNVTYEPMKQCLVTVGGSEAIDVALRCILEPGDEVLVPEPSFVCYNPCTVLAGGVAVPIVTKAEDDFKLTAAALKAAITPKTKALVLPFPNNPTGGIMTREDLEEIAAVLRGTDIMILSDEIYAELTYSGKHVSIAEIDGMYERTILISGFSKAFSMTGWRLGYACGPAEVINAMMKVHQYAIMCSPTVAQYAGIEAMKRGVPDAEAMAEEYDRRRRVILKGVRDIGLPCFTPYGAFYIFPDIRGTGYTSEEFCEKLLESQQVAVVPGNAFGESGEGFIRISYAYSMQKIGAALERMGKFLRNL